VVLIEGAGNINAAGSNVDNALVGNSGNNDLDGKGAHDLMTGNGGDDRFLFSSGEADGDAVVDFAGNDAATGDSFLFSGFGTAAQGATFTQIGATNQWQIHSGLDGHNEGITLQNGASVNASDFVFV
jgi:Ca2+-binding RTX toxin-like protein